MPASIRYCLGFTAARRTRYECRTGSGGNPILPSCLDLGLAVRLLVRQLGASKPSYGASAASAVTGVTVRGEAFGRLTGLCIPTAKCSLPRFSNVSQVSLHLAQVSESHWRKLSRTLAACRLPKCLPLKLPSLGGLYFRSVKFTINCADVDV